jgi:hypothetical protein
MMAGGVGLGVYLVHFVFTTLSLGKGQLLKPASDTSFFLLCALSVPAVVVGNTEGEI